MLSVLLFICLVFVRATPPAYIITDGCPERNPDSDYSPTQCFDGWDDREFRDWVFHMCSSDNSHCPQGSTYSPSESGPTGPSVSTSGPSPGPSDSPSALPTFITTVVDTIINRLTQEPTVAPTEPLPTSVPPSGSPTITPSGLPSDIPSGAPSTVPSEYPTWISTSTVRCPLAKKKSS